MISTHSFSEVGGHVENEDAFAVQQHRLDPDLSLCFMADGQGGQAGGGQAARLACHTASSLASTFTPKDLQDPRTWATILQQVDEAVRVDPTAGYTTFVGLCVSHERVVGASSGDSAAMLICENSVTQLTSGQRKNPPVGCGEAEAVSFAASVNAPWRLLVMTDGVWKYVGWKRITELVRYERGASLVDKLQQVARLPGSGQFQDDFTVVVLECEAEVG